MPAKVVKTFTCKMEKGIEYMLMTPFWDAKGIAEYAQVDYTTAKNWLRSPIYMDTYKEQVEKSWGDAAYKCRMKMQELADGGDRQANEFILKCNGENPAQKVELDATGEINVTIGF